MKETSKTNKKIELGSYFVNYAIARNGDGGNRKVKQELNKEEKNEKNKDVIQINKEKARKSAEDWASKIQNKKVQVIAKDGIILRGTQYIINEKYNRWAIVLHGYRSKPASVLTIGENFSKKGYNVLIPSMRGCAESEGEYIGMGWLDKDDLQYWIKLLIQENPNSEIILHGSSMGAATVLMASGDELPKNVKAIIADSGYTSVWDIFASEAKVRFKLPAIPLLNIFQKIAKVKAKYDIKQASSLEQVKKSKTPILYIHGDADDFVPEYMCEELYNATKCPKDKLIIEKAGHTQSKYKEPEKYYKKVFEFIDKILEK